MALLFDYKKNAPVNVDDSQVSSAVASGNFGFRKSVKIPVVGPDGEVGTIDAAEAPEAFRNGFVFQTKQMSDELRKNRIESARAEAYDKPLLAGAAGALRGFTLGASDIVLGAAGAGEATREIKERSPDISMATEIGGSVLASALAAPATSALAASTATKLGGSTLARTAGTAASMGVEGAVQGLGTTVSDIALGDPQLTFERGVMNIGLGAVLGGGLGGLGKGATETISSLNSALRASTLPTATADVIGKAYAKLTGITKALPKDEADDVLKIFTKDRAAVLDMVENPAKFEQMAVDAVSKVDAIGASVNDLSMQARDAFRDPLSKVADFRVNKEAAKLSKEIGDAIRTIDAKPTLYANVSETAKQINTDFVTAVKKAKTKGDVHVAVEDARKMLDSYMLDFGAEIPKGKAQATQNVFKDVRAAFKNHLVDENLYGNFGKQYGEINTAYNKFRTVKKEFEKEFTRKTVDQTGRVIKEVDPTKVLSWFKNPENLVKMRKEMRLDELADSIANLSSKTGLDPKIISSLDVATKAIDEIKDTRAMALLINRLESVTGRSTLAGQVGAGIGAIAGGIPGAGVGMLFGAASANPKTILKILSRVESLGIKGNQKMTSSLQNLLGTPLAGAISATGKAGEYASRRVTIPMALNLFRGSQSEAAPSEEENGAHIELRKELDKLDGGKLDDRLTQLNPYLDEVSPNYYAQMHQTITNTAQFIRSKMPQIDNADMFGNTADMSRADKGKLETYIDAAFRPARALEELQSENPDPRVFETIGAIYPALYSDLQQRTLEIATKNPKLSYKKKLALGMAFGIPTVPGLAHAELMIGDPAGALTQDEQKQAQPAQKPRALSSSRTEKILSQFQTDSQNAFG